VLLIAQDDLALALPGCKSSPLGVYFKALSSRLLNTSRNALALARTGGLGKCPCRFRFRSPAIALADPSSGSKTSATACCPFRIRQQQHRLLCVRTVAFINNGAETAIFPVLNPLLSAQSPDQTVAATPGGDRLRTMLSTHG